MNINNNTKNGKTITFYSYKGGVGRSMALVNIACLMSRQKKRVLIIDWDLEAPGLHLFFKNSFGDNNLGLVDLFTDLQLFIDTNDNNNEVGYNNFLSNNLNKYILNNLIIDEDNFQIDILKAGKFDDHYTNKLNAIDWISLYKKAPSFFRIFAQFLEQNYDYILIDSRTGLSDTSGVCTMLMPKILVLVFALNNQNINGVLDVAKQSAEYRFNSIDYRSLQILPLPSRIENENPQELANWIKIYKGKFEVLFKEIYLLDNCELENYFNISKIPYTPLYAYGENIPVLKENANNDFFISYHYAQFLKIVQDPTPIWDILSFEQMEINKKLANDYFQKGTEHYFNKYYEKSIKQFERAIELNPKNDVPYNFLGTAYGYIAKEKKDEKLYYLSIEKLQEASIINPNYDGVYNNLGIMLSELGLIRNDMKLFEESLNSYKKAIALNPNNESTYSNWGHTIFEFGKLNKMDNLIIKSVTKYKKAISLNPEFEVAYLNWGNALVEIAKIKNKSSLYFHKSFFKFKKAIELNSNNADAYINWGVAIYELAKLNSDTELFKSSFEKFTKAVEINPKSDHAYTSWGIAIKDLAKLTNEKELYYSSLEKYIKANELCGRFYNLSCGYALIKNKDKAIENLEMALNKKEISLELILKDEDWIFYKSDVDFKNLIKRFSIKNK